jgi:hypothetical protein
MRPVNPSQYEITDHPSLSDRTREQIEARLIQVAQAGHEGIRQRLTELDAEWTAGRVAKIGLAIATLAGVLLAALWTPWWLVLPGVCGLMLLEHAIARECGLTRLMREAGWRSAIEIEHERWALKAIRGDFRHLPELHNRDEEESLARLEGEGGRVDEPMRADQENRAVVREMLEAIEDR